LRRQDVKVKYAEPAFVVDGQHFEKGSLIILRTSNQKFGDSLENMVMNTISKDGFKASVTKVYTGFVDRGYDF
jgi:hypothetical protein